MKCNGKHHTSICFSKKREIPTDSRANGNTTEATQTIVATNGDGEITPTDTAGTVLLQSTCAKFMNPSSENEATSRMTLILVANAAMSRDDFKRR